MGLCVCVQYVREEFKAHKDVPPAQADAFMKTWQEYWVHLARARVRFEWSHGDVGGGTCCARHPVNCKRLNVFY